MVMVGRGDGREKNANPRRRVTDPPVSVISPLYGRLPAAAYIWVARIPQPRGGGCVGVAWTGLGRKFI
jgi:hypothetical protein